MLKVSILTPIYGVEKYIEQSARSLFEQSYASIEYIFVDDCTPDKSIGILQSLLKEYPERAQQVRIIHHDRNRGVGAARQTALMAATGDYLLFADSDDMLPEDAVEKLAGKADSSHADLIDGATGNGAMKRQADSRNLLTFLMRNCSNCSFARTSSPIVCGAESISVRSSWSTGYSLRKASTMRKIFSGMPSSCSTAKR